MLYKIVCNPMQPHYGSLPVHHVPVRDMSGALVVNWYTYAPPRYRTSQYLSTFISLSMSLWNDLADPVFDGVGLTGFKNYENVFSVA